MFTGIVQAVGEILAIERKSSDCTLRIAPGKLDFASTRIGDSIAVNGVCLTVTDLQAGRFAADVSNESLALTTLGGLRPGSPVNLEKALTLATPLGGHLVSGHVDATATLLCRQPDGRSWRFWFALPGDLMRFVAPKGSVTLDGVSLTVNSVGPDTFSVNLIPQTLHETTLTSLSPGQRVNVEVDLIARYLERLLAFRASASTAESDALPSDTAGSGLTLEKLARFGFD